MESVYKTTSLYSSPSKSNETSYEKILLLPELMTQEYYETKFDRNPGIEHRVVLFEKLYYERGFSGDNSHGIIKLFPRSFDISAHSKQNYTTWSNSINQLSLLKFFISNKETVISTTFCFIIIPSLNWVQWRGLCCVLRPFLICL